MEKVQIALELPKPVYEFLRKAVKDPQKLLQETFESSLGSLFDYYWGDRYSDVSSLLRECCEMPKFNPGFEPISDEEIMQRIREALRSRM